MADGYVMARRYIRVRVAAGKRVSNGVGGCWLV
jgi:hypothetical protein